MTFVNDNSEFLSQSFEEILTDQAFESRDNTDAIRRILKLLNEVYPERVAAGLSGF